jgi:hypothetical protein
MLVVVILLAWLLVATVAGGALLFMNRSAPSSTDAPSADIRGEWLESVTTRRLLVHTTDDRSIEGLLAQVGADGIVLVSAKLITSGSSVDLAGNTWIPRAQVSLVQTVPESH